MEQLISMRQRIKAVETTKKITHAMRLISMSNHSRLRNKKSSLENYKKAFQDLWLKIQSNIKAPINFEKKPTLAKKNLVIIVGSEKGLCGKFNSSLFKFFESNYKIDPTDSFITVGKKAKILLEKNFIQCPPKTHETSSETEIDKNNIIYSYDKFNSTNFIFIANAITDLILKNESEFKSVILFSNHPKSFFIQDPELTNLLPLKPVPQNNQTQNTKEYIFEQSPKELAITIKQMILTVMIQDLLFDSLLAEQAARFLSMDNATHNADNLINSMKLQYNKLRQAGITRELTELSSNY